MAQAYDVESPIEERNRKRGVIASFGIHAIILILAFLNFMTFPDPPPGQEGVLVSFGEPNVGQGEEEPAPPPTPVEEEEEEEVAPEPEPEPVEEEPEPVEDVPEPEPVKPDPDPGKKVITDDASKELAIKKAKEEREKRAKEREEKAKRDAEAAKKRAEEEAKRKAAAEAKRKAEAEAKRKAEEEARKKAEYEKQKDAIGGLFGGGKSQGNSGTPGNAGNPNGDPDGQALEGISSGAGKVGGGLANRGGAGPKISEDFNEKGTVRIRLCVDGNGKVIPSSIEYKLSGSSTQSSRLIAIAKNNAKRWRFDSGESNQCGFITYTFKLR